MILVSSHIKKWHVAATLIAALIIGICFGEYAGWPFLAAPLEKQLSAILNRQISFESGGLKSFSKNDNLYKQSPTVKLFELTFLGGLTLSSVELNVGAPNWSKKPYFIKANNIKLKLRYVDIWRAYRGLPIRIKSLQATRLDGYIERLADGRASWQFGKKSADPNKPLQLPAFDQLLVTSGLLHIDDVPLNSKIEAQLSLSNNAVSKQSNILKNSVLTASAIGSYKALPFKIQLVSTGKLPTSIDQPSDELPVTITLNAVVGRANLIFKGTAANVLHLNNFAGSFNLKGPSLAAVGDLIGVTLPTTAEFNTDGVIEKQNRIWYANINQIVIGDSHLNGHFSYDSSLNVPMLKGQLGGKKLVITDLGPAFGTTSDNKNPNKVLPSRPFDLASLHKMNADVLVDIQYLDLKSKYLEPFNPLQGHLQLKNAVLSFSNIKASTAGGRLTGNISLDGRTTKALWDANLGWNGVRLEHWIKQKRGDGLPPYISGKLNGKAILKGQGKSTAEILASLNGDIRGELNQGAVSHLSIEVAGLDLAQSIGVLFKGDDALPIQCGVVDLRAKNGVFMPKVMVVDTTDTTLWVDGSLSLAAETLNLRATALPKDFSPLTLRAPLHVTGSFARPEVSLEKKPVGLKLAASALLALVNPLAAVLPLLDSGDIKEAKQRAAGCRSLMKR